MTELPQFIYDQLPPGHIRLLTPTSSLSKDDQSWSLQTVSLEQPDLAYDALSYVWGSRADLFPITLNGRISYVHRNLRSALSCLAERGNARPVLPIWIDAICINQAHHQEKMIQIREMNRIYRHAAKVWVWLGISEHPERISEAMDLLVVKLAKENRILDLDSIHPPLRSTICHLMMNDWFRRLWVVQEAALAREISFISGDVELQWSDMKEAMANTEKYILMNEQCSSTTFYARSWVQLYWNDAELLGVSPASILMNVASLVAETQECTWPEDRIFGLLGLVDQDDLLGTSLDTEIVYTSYQDLFTRFSAYVLTEYPTQNGIEWWRWLSLAFGPEKCEGLPSWVPDLHAISKTIHSGADLEFRVPSYQAATRWNNKPRGGLKIGQLVLRGRILDEVVTVFEPIPMDGGSYLGGSSARQNEILMAVAKWEEKLAHAVMHSLSFETRQEDCVGLNRDITLDTYWRTLIGNNASVQDEAVMQDWYDDLRAIGRSFRKIDTAHETER